MLPRSKGLIYSYRDFTEQDLNLTESDLRFSLKSIESLDNINLEDLTVEEQSLFMQKNFHAYKNDMNTKMNYRNKFFFKEFCIRYPSDHENIDKINRYSVSAWNDYSKRKHIDDRNLTVELFDAYLNSGRARRTLRFIVKTEHVYQLIKDLYNTLRIIDDFNDVVVTDNDVNLYVLPIYVYHTYTNEYIRISELVYNDYTMDTLYNILEKIRNSLKEFAAINYYMLDMYNSNNKVDVYNTKTRKFSNVTFKAYASTADNDKKVYSYIHEYKPNEYNPSIKINIDTDRPNVLAGSDIPRKLCDYRYTVRGHKSHRWIGKRGNQQLKEVWIDSYEKNKDKPFKIIKETKLK